MVTPRHYVLLFKKENKEITFPIHKKNAGKFSGCPGFFGGGQELGDQSFKDTLIREVNEESGTTISVENSRNHFKKIVNIPPALNARKTENLDYFNFYWTSKWEETGNNWQENPEISRVETIELSKLLSPQGKFLAPEDTAEKLIELSCVSSEYTETTKNNFICSKTARAFAAFVYAEASER